MSDGVLVARRSIESAPEIVSSSIAKQFERARCLVGMTRAVGPINAAKSVYGRVTGTDMTAPITVRPNQLRHPLTMTASPYDVYGYKEVLTDGVYDLPQTLSDRINGKPIVDVGAYIGISAAFFASRYPDSSVLAVEPHPRNFRFLSANAAPYGDQIDARHAAFVAEAGVVGSTMHESPQSHMTHQYSSENSGGANGNAARCAALTPELLLAALEGEEIGLLKIDIEGGEKDVFEAPEMGEVLAATGMLMVETHDNFVPGSSAAVEAATAAIGMEPLQLNEHTSVYLQA